MTAYLSKNDVDFFMVKGLSADKVASPTFTVQAESLQNTPNIIPVNCATANAEMHYTTDGSEPTLTSPAVCAAKIYAYDTAEYRIKAFKLGLQPSDTVTTGRLVSAWTGSRIPREGLVGEWLFDENANDTSGNGNHGTVNGGASLLDDRYGGNNSSYGFNGSDGYILIGDPVPNILQLCLRRMEGQGMKKVPFSLSGIPNR